MSEIIAIGVSLSTLVISIGTILLGGGRLMGRFETAVSLLERDLAAMVNKLDKYIDRQSAHAQDLAGIREELRALRGDIHRNAKDIQGIHERL